VLADDQTLVINTLWHSAVAIVAVNLRSGALVRLSPESASYHVQANDGRALIASTSTIQSLPGIAVLPIAQALQAFELLDDAVPRWVHVRKLLQRDDVPEGVAELIDDIEVERLQSPSTLGLLSLCSSS
jgi:hypothetical protein